MSLVKTAELDPDKSYVFGFHPHGVISLSAFCTFGTEALEFSRVFPGGAAAQVSEGTCREGSAEHALLCHRAACMHQWSCACAGITPHMLTLVQNFYVPFMREVLLLHGVCNCARKTCLNLLSKCAAGPIPNRLAGTALAARIWVSCFQLDGQWKMTRERRRDGKETACCLFYVEIAQCWCACRGSGSAIVLCVGGAREALLAEPGTFEIVLGKRLVRASVARAFFKHATLLHAHVSQALAAGVPGC